MGAWGAHLPNMRGVAVLLHIVRPLGEHLRINIAGAKIALSTTGVTVPIELPALLAETLNTRFIGGTTEKRDKAGKNEERPNHTSHANHYKLDHSSSHPFIILREDGQRDE